MLAADNQTFELTETESQWLAQKEQIRIGAMKAWPPFNFVDQYGKSTGIGADYITALNKRLNGKLVIESGNWNELFDAVKTQQLDAILDINRKPEREHYFLFTKPYLQVPHVIVAPKNAPFLRDEQDLKGKVIALERGFGNVTYFEETFPETTIKLYKNTALALDAVSRGQADAYAGNRSAALYWIGKEVMVNLKVHGRLNTEGSQLSIGVRTDEPILVKILDRALADIRQEEVRMIQNRWVGNNDNNKQVLLTEQEQQWIKENPIIKIAFDQNYPPYSFKNEQGNFEGVAVDIAFELANRIGVELNIHPEGQWLNLYQDAIAGKVDVVATLVKTPDREDNFNFTQPYISLSRFIVTKKEDRENIASTDDLRGKTIALIEGYSTSSQVIAKYPSITPYYVKNIQESLKAVSAGLADAAIADIGMAQHAMTLLGLTNLGFASVYVDNDLDERYGVHIDKPILASILDKALESLSYQEYLAFYSNWSVPYTEKIISGVQSKNFKLTESEKAWLDKHKVIRLASDYSWPPFEYIEKDGTYHGIGADYMALIEQRLGIRFEVSPRRAWQEITDMVANKELDILSCAMETEQRQKYAIFTQPYISHPMIIVTRDNIDFVEGIDGLAGKKVSIEKGYGSYDLMLDRHPEVNIIPYTDSLSAMMAVSNGEVFAYIGNIATMSYVARQNGITNIKISGQVPYRFDLSIGVRDDWPEFIPILQKALNSITREEHNQIRNKWIAIDVEKPFNYTIIWQVGSLVIIILVSFLFWNLSLNKRVKERTQQLTYQANYDSLTQLPNRAYVLKQLNDLLEKAVESRDKLAVLFLDLDDFKIINDTMGHDAGDQLLIEASQRMKKSLGENHIVGRMGGDEFIAIIRDYDDDSQTTLLADRLIDNFKNKFEIDNQEIKMSTSIGIATYPEDGTSSSTLLSHADAAMYHSKRQGRSTYSHFTEEMNREVERRIEIEKNMQGALERNEFSLVYQPKVDIASRRIIGVEALLRWHSPQLGSVAPDEFIPIAENNGHILPIGEFVLKTAIERLNEWQNKFDLSLTMAVNLSPIQFRDPNLSRNIRESMEQIGIQLSSLELEVTEGVLLKGHNFVQKAISELKSLGVHLSMDDFGTGYSSLSYLRKYPFDRIKIDREFIKGITDNETDRQLVYASIEMAHGLNLSVVAEGVETDSQLSILAERYCDIAQGYLFSKPLPYEQMTQFLQDHFSSFNIDQSA